MIVVSTACGKRVNISQQLYNATDELVKALYKNHANAIACMWNEDMLEWEVVYKEKWWSFVAFNAKGYNEDTIMLAALALIQSEEGIKS